MADPIAYVPADLDIAAKTLYGECRGEPLQGRQAVAWVIRNRAGWRPIEWWGSTIGGVCLKRMQFSCWNEPTRNMPNPEYDRMQRLSDNDPALMALREVARSVFAGEVDDPTQRATHYQRVGTGASWSKGQIITLLCGHHEFFALGPDA